MPSAAQLATQDPTGASPYGRWMYGPWFWPPATQATTPYQPIPNPYYDPACNATAAPNGFCEPPLIPGTPNISVGMERQIWEFAFQHHRIRTNRIYRIA